MHAECYHEQMYMVVNRTTAFTGTMHLALYATVVYNG